MNLDPDLQRILNVGAKVYEVESKRQGRVVSLSDNFVVVDYGNNVKSDVRDYETLAFKQKLVNDEIVSNSRLSMGNGNSFKVKPRPATLNIDTKGKTMKGPTSQVQELPRPKEYRLEIGYINFKTGRFSETKKKGYTKVEYRKATTKIELEIDEDQLRKLKEMGLV